MVVTRGRGIWRFTKRNDYAYNLGNGMDMLLMPTLYQSVAEALGATESEVRQNLRYESRSRTNSLA